MSYFLIKEWIQISKGTTSHLWCVECDFGCGCWLGYFTWGHNLFGNARKLIGLPWPIMILPFSSTSKPWKHISGYLGIQKTHPKNKMVGQPMSLHIQDSLALLQNIDKHILRMLQDTKSLIVMWGNKRSVWGKSIISNPRKSSKLCIVL